MKTLKQIDLCLHSNPGDCFFHIFLLYKSEGQTMSLPHGHPVCPCDNCQWLNRTEDFYTPME